MKLITTDEYILWIDENKKPQDNDLHYSERWNCLHSHTFRNIEGSCYSILAHLPLNNAPLLGSFDLLPDLPKQKDDVEELALKEYNRRTAMIPVPTSIWLSEKEGFIEWFKTGYKTNTNKYNDEDIQAAYTKGWEDQRLGLLNHNSDYIKSLLTITLPTEFIAETEPDPTDETNWYVDVPSGKYWEDESIAPSPDRLYTNSTRRYKTTKVTIQGIEVNQICGTYK